MSHNTNQNYNEININNNYYIDEGSERFWYIDDFKDILKTQALKDLINKLNEAYYNNTYDEDDEEFLHKEINIFISNLSNNDIEYYINQYTTFGVKCQVYLEKINYDLEKSDILYNILKNNIEIGDIDDEE
jgi:hypothetical protein